MNGWSAPEVPILVLQRPGPVGKAVAPDAALCAARALLSDAQHKSKSDGACIDQARPAGLRRCHEAVTLPQAWSASGVFFED
jgi:hypothetical protein